jgi:hypothetical protein
MKQAWGHKEMWFAWFPVYDSGWTPSRGSYRDVMWPKRVQRMWGPAPYEDWKSGCCVRCCWHYRDLSKWGEKAKVPDKGSDK